jgi:hypothetical protein
MVKTPAQRKQDERDRRKLMGHILVSEYVHHKDDVKPVKKLAEKLRKSRSVVKPIRD